MRTFNKRENNSQKKSRKINKKIQLEGGASGPPYLFFKTNNTEMTSMFNRIFSDTGDTGAPRPKLNIKFEEISNEKRVTIEYLDSKGLNENIAITGCPPITSTDITCVYGGYSTVFDTSNGLILKITNTLQDPSELSELNGLKIHMKLTKINQKQLNLLRPWPESIPSPTNNMNFISEIYSYGTIHPSFLFSTMKKYDGDLLQYYINNKTQYLKLLGICVQIIYGIKILHDNKILYRDLKPDNIVINDSSGGIPSIAIIDFGLSIDLNTYTLSPVLGGGTLKYAAPEARVGGNISYEIDIYSFAKVIEVLGLNFIKQHSKVIEYCLETNLPQKAFKKVYRPDAHEVLYGGAYIEIDKNQHDFNYNIYKKTDVKYSVNRYLKFSYKSRNQYYIVCSSTSDTDIYIYFDGTEIKESLAPPTPHSKIFIKVTEYVGILDIFKYYKDNPTVIDTHIQITSTLLDKHIQNAFNAITAENYIQPGKITHDPSDIMKIYDTNRGVLQDTLDIELGKLKPISDNSSKPVTYDKTWQEVLIRIIHNETYNKSREDKKNTLDLWKSQVGELGDPASYILENAKKNGGFFAIRQ
jgi:serine/threonine protein kinase